MLSRLAITLAEFPPARKYLVAVSGGADSMVLLHLLHRLNFTSLVVCHLNHQLRGAQSDADALLVEETASQLGCDCIMETCPVQVLATEQKLSIETAARQARQDFFRQCADSTGCSQIFLAHHADDQAETVLMNVLRGTGLRGLGGMRLRSMIQDLEFVRPLLEFSREEIHTWATTNEVRFHEDASNASADYARNRLRHELIPAANKAMQRDVRPALSRLALTAQAEEEFLAQTTATMFPPNQETFSTTELLAAPLAIQRRAIRSWLNEHEVPLVSFELIEEIRAILPTAAAAAKCNLPGGRWARRRAGVLFLEEKP